MCITKKKLVTTHDQSRFQQSKLQVTGIVVLDQDSTSHDASFGTSVGVAVGRLSGDQLATTLVDRYFHHSFFFFFFIFSPLSTFLIEGVLESKNLFSESGWKWPIT